MKKENFERVLGRIEGRLEGIENGVHTLQNNMTHLDDRLRTVESRSIKNGIFAGAFMGVGTSILASLIRAKLG